MRSPLLPRAAGASLAGALLAACAATTPPAPAPTASAAPAVASPAATSSPAVVAKSSPVVGPRSGGTLGGLDLAAAFQFDPGAGAAVGYVTALTIGGTALPADLPVAGPGTTPGAVVGVLAALTWNGGVADPLVLDARVSAATRTALAGAASGGAVRLSYQVWMVDARTGGPFKGHTTDVTAEGTLVDGRLTATPVTEPEPDATIGEPAVYPARFVVGPAPNQQQTLLVATSAATKVTKPWGTW